MGLGIIIRDDEGRMEEALSKKIYALLGAMEAEAKAFEVGLLFAKHIGIQEFILEGDSLIVHHALYETSLPPSSVEPIIMGMHALSKDFCHVDYSHIRRQDNRPAHLLAKYVLGIVDFTMWIEENPYFLEQALIHDVMSSSHS